MTDTSLDAFDLRLLDALQRDARASLYTLAEKVGLSSSQVGRRLKRLEDSGVLAGYAALLDAAAIGLGVEAVTFVSLERHGAQPTDAFDTAIGRMPEILDCVAVTGESDYILRIVAPDLQAFSDFLLERLMPLAGVRSVRSSIVLRRVKRQVVLPLAHLSRSSSGGSRRPPRSATRTRNR